MTNSEMQLLENQHQYIWLDTLSDLKHENIASSQSVIYMQSERSPEESLDEIRQITILSKQQSNIHGMMAWAPLELGLSSEPHLATLRKNPFVKGVCRMMKNNDFGQPALVSGIKLLSYYHFPLVLCIETYQHSLALELMNQCPKVEFLLHYLDKF